MRHPLPGATFLVTGGGSGIGRLLSLRSADEGAHVVIWDLSASAGESVRDEIRARGGHADSYAIDVTDREAVKTAAEVVGPVDILVNNAGVVTGKRLLDATEEEIERTFDVNVMALYWTTRAFLGGMIERRHGAVMTVSSAAGLVGVAKQTDYSASKFAAFGFAESLRAELAKDATGVDSLVACPFYIDTGMFAGVRTKVPRLLPILDQDYAAGRILTAIVEGRQQLVMPRMVGVIPAARLLPVKLFDRVMNLFGVNDTMDAFTGRGRDLPDTTGPAVR